MLLRTPKSKAKKYFKTGFLALVAGEVFCFACSYGVWFKLNRDRDTRKYFKENYPKILNTYYNLGELLDSTNKCRQVDEQIWKLEN